MGKLENKVAVISGGNSGIGLATAKLYREAGAKVVVTASSDKSYQTARTELGDHFDVVKTDVTDRKQIQALADHVKKEYGQVDILFANAGVVFFAPISDVDEGFIDQQFDINFKGVFFLVQSFAPLLKQGSSVILTTSGLNNKGMPGASIYSATKAAVRSLARSFSAELGPQGIRVNALSPGPVETPIFSRAGLSEEEMRGMAEQIQSVTPVGRFGQADELARAALFLGSDDSSFALGSELVVDGGYTQL